MRLGYTVREDTQVTYSGSVGGRQACCYEMLPPRGQKSPAFLGKQLEWRLTKCITCQPQACVFSQMCWRLCLLNTRGLSSGENVAPSTDVAGHCSCYLHASMAIWYPKSYSRGYRVSPCKPLLRASHMQGHKGTYVPAIVRLKCKLLDSCLLGGG